MKSEERNGARNVLGVNPTRFTFHVSLFTLLVATFFSGFSVLRHESYNSGAFDLGIFAQAVWSTAQGRFLATTVGPSPIQLGEHFSPLVGALAPVYWLGGGVNTLLVVQSFLLVSPAILLAPYGRSIGLTGVAALVPPIAYLLNPSLFAAASFDFREVSLAPPFLALSLFGLLTGRRALFLFGGLTTLFIREDLGVLFAASGLWAVWRRRWWWTGLAAFGLGIAGSALAIGVVIPSFHGGADYFSISRSRGLDTSPAGLVEAALGILSLRKLGFLLALVLSFGALPLFAPATLLLALPNLGYLLLGSYPALTDLLSHYPLTLLPVLGFATADGLAAIVKRLAPRPRLAKALLFASLVPILVIGIGGMADLIPRRLDNGFVFDPAHRAIVAEMLSLIPPAATISAQTGLVPHLERRHQLTVFPILADAEWIALDTRAQRVVHGSESYDSGLFEIVCDRVYQPIFDRDGALLFRRGFADPGWIAEPPAGATRIGRAFGDAIQLAATEIPKSVVRPDELIPVVLFWQPTAVSTRDWSVFVHLVDDAGQVRAQYDSPPLCGDAQTSQWRPGRFLRDPYYLIPQRNLAAGDYRVLVGMLDPATGQRPLIDGRDERITLGNVTVKR